MRTRHELLAIGIAVALAGSAAFGQTTANERAPAAKVGRSSSGESIFFDGFIDDAAVSKFAEELRTAPAATLWIRSTGGHVGSGIRFGELVRDAAIDVVVKDYCMSSCANYVFVAAKRRFIMGVVAWHGSVEQKDFREDFECGRSVSSLTGSKMPRWTPTEKDEARAAWSVTRARQAAFFASIGVDEYITRAGQEPVRSGDLFTYDVPTMERFGLRNITASPDYGTAAWCDRANSGGARLKLNCVTLTDEMLAYESARRERGEECQADGTLRVRPVPH